MSKKNPNDDGLEVEGVDLPEEVSAPRGITTAEAPARIAFHVVKLCGNCDHFARAPEPNQARGLCHGVPPVPICTGMQSSPVGPQPVISAYYPVVDEKRKKCGMWEPIDDSGVDFTTLGAKQ